MKEQQLKQKEGSIRGWDNLKKVLVSIVVIIVILVNFIIAWEWFEGKMATIMRYNIKQQVQASNIICKKAKYYYDCAVEWEY